MTSRVIPLGLIVSYLKELLDGDALVSDVWIEGEVSQVFRARSGHVYFVLKDDDVTLKCVLFRTLAERQPRLPEVGDNVAAHGRIGLYEREGTVQLYADVVQAAGLGVVALRFEQLRQRLESEGLFDESRKRPVPPHPKVIGVVTSPDGSVWHDIQHVLQRRYPLVEVVLAPSLVQGDRAPESLISALRAIQRLEDLDVIIVARGGGSAEDLAAFNDEAFAREVFRSRIPVISAVGHETDWTIIDFVADARAATPSVAAELCVPSKIDLLEQVGARRAEILRGVAELVVREQRSLAGQHGRLERIDMRAALSRRRRALEHQRQALDRHSATLVGNKLQRLIRQRAVLRTLDPRAVLRRGYALVMDPETGTVVSSGQQAASRYSLQIEFADAELAVRRVRNGLRRRDEKELSLGIDAAE